MKRLAVALALLLLAAAPGPPTFAFYCEELLCYFFQTSGTGPQSWTFGDGYQTTDPDPWYFFDRPGVYPVTLETPEGSVTNAVTVYQSTFKYPCVVVRGKCKR